MRSILPDMTAGNAEKDSPKFGLQMARFIESEWDTTRIQDQRHKIQKMRAHMNGTVDVSHFKPLFKSSNDASTLRVNWKYHSEVPRFVNSNVESFSYDKYRISVKGVDIHSQEKKSKFRREKLKAMYMRDDMEQLSQRFGMDFTPKGFIPQSKDELNLYMDLEYKPATELATELAIQKVYDFNDWRETLNHMAEDLMLFGKAVARVKQDPQTALSFEYTDPESFIHSRDTGNNRDHRNAYYFGFYQRMTIGDLEREAGGELSQEQIRNLMGRAGFTYKSFEHMSEEDKMLSVDVIWFAFKANRYEVKKKKYNKHGGYKYIDKDDYWQPPEGMKSEVLYMPYEVWYEGIYIPGTDIVIKYGVMDNMLRDPRDSSKAISPFVMYNLSSEALGEQLADICDDIYITQVKLQQLTLKLKPKGVAIDIDALGTLDMPDGSKLKPLQQVKLMREEGDLLFSGSDLIDDSGNIRLPVHDLPDGHGQELSELLNIYNHHINRLHQLTGISPQATGAAPPSRTSSSVYEGTLAASQRVINNVFNGVLSIQHRSAEAIIARLHAASIMKDTKHIVEAIMGEFTTDIIKELSNLGYYQFIVNVDLRPTNEERAQLIQSMSEALQTGSISIEDKIDIEEIDNLRLAKQMIKIRQRQNRERAERQAQIEYQRNLQLKQVEYQSKLQYEQTMAEIENQKTMAEYELKAMLQERDNRADLREISLKGQWDLAVARAKEQAKYNSDKYKEDRKDKRVSLENSQQSEMIEQRNRDSGSKQFPERTTDDQSDLDNLIPNV